MCIFDLKESSWAGTEVSINNYHPNTEDGLYAGGGNPAPELVWYFNKELWRGKGEVLEEGEGEQVSRIRIPVTRDDHGGEVRCEVRHKALTDTDMKAVTKLDIHCEYFGGISFSTS